jgi:hypothetical protein
MKITEVQTIPIDKKRHGVLGYLVVVKTDEGIIQPDLCHCGGFYEGFKIARVGAWKLMPRRWPSSHRKRSTNYINHFVAPAYHGRSALNDESHRWAITRSSTACSAVGDSRFCKAVWAYKPT